MFLRTDIIIESGGDGREEGEEEEAAVATAGVMKTF